MLIMVSNKILSWTKTLEDPKNPLLGPTLKGLYAFGLWQTGSKLWTVMYNFVHFSTFLFVVTEYVDLYSVRHDINKVLTNLSIAGLSTMCFAKCYSYVFWQQHWMELVKMISEEELLQIQKKDPIAKKHRRNYTMYSRILTYLYWMLVFTTLLFTIAVPLLKYATTKAYHMNLNADVEPYPQIISSWFPFDKTKMPGYLGALFVHITMTSQGSAVLGVYDMNAIAILCYLKGQMKILKEKCECIFDDVTSTQDVLNRIKDCHRHHNALLKQYKLFNSLLSPTMFMYVLLCSVTICCNVVQFSSKEVTTSQKVRVLQLTVTLISQLFLYCWHSNDVTIEIMKASYSFYTLFSQMQNN